MTPIEDIEREAEGIDFPLILCGHTHIPRVARLRDGRHIVNPGSVGCRGYDDDAPVHYVIQSGTPDACYGVLEKEGDRWTASSAQLPPLVGFGSKSGALRLDDTKALAGWGFHHPPGPDLLHPLGAQFLQASHPRFDIVCFDIEVYPARMIDFLDFDMQIVPAAVEQHIVRIRWIRASLGRITERSAPKAGGRIEIIGLTIDDETCEAASVHRQLLR